MRDGTIMVRVVLFINSWSDERANDGKPTVGWTLGSYWKNCGKYCGNDDEPCSKKVFVIQFNWGYPVTSVSPTSKWDWCWMRVFIGNKKNGSEKQAFIRQKSEDQKWSAAKIERVDAQEPTRGAAIARMWVWHMFAPSKDRDKWDTWYDRDIIKVPRSKSESLGMGWVPLGTWKIGRFTGLLKRSHGQSGWTYTGDPLKPQRYQGLCPWFPKLQGMPLKTSGQPGEQPKNMNRMEWVTKLGCSFTRSRHLLTNFWPRSIFLYSPSLSVCGAAVSKISTCLMVLLRKYICYLPATSQNGSPLKASINQPPPKQVSTATAPNQTPVM